MSSAGIPAGLPEGAKVTIIIRREFQVWVPRSDGRYYDADKNDGPSTIGRLDAASLAGLVPSTIVQDPVAGKIYGVALDGTTYELAATGSLGDLGDLTTTEQDDLVGALNEVDAHADALLTRLQNRLLARYPLVALLADVDDLRTKLTAAVADITELRGKLNTQVSAYNATLAKLDADIGSGGASETNYAATNPATAPAAVTATNPAAATATASNGIGNGTTAGRLRLNSDVEYSIAGTIYRKASADNLWNLSAETDTSGAQYRAYWLYLDSSGTASFGAGTNAASAAAAVAALPAVTSTKAVIGVYVAGLSTDFDAGGGLAAQGTIYNGWPGTAF